jgi:hypothetical protein
MTAPKIRFLALACSLATFACGSDDTKEESFAWKGAEAHLVAQGYLNGEDISIALTGSAAQDPEKLWCSREYVGPDDGTGEPDVSRAKLQEVTLNAIVNIGGQDRLLQLELKPHDFQSDTVPTQLKVVARVEDQTPPSNALWAEFEWLTADGEGDILETSAQAGTFRLELFTGEPGEDGLVIPEGEGMFGGSLAAKWSEQEELRISVSAPCLESELDLP